MNKKKYLIYMDILGFKELAEKIAIEKHIEEREVRCKFHSVINEKVDVIEEKGIIIGKPYRGTDDWLLVTDDLDNVFRIISETLGHYTGYRDYRRIPLEIGVGTAEFDKWAKFNGKDLIMENETIKLLKTDILSYYRKWYKKKKRERIESTFIVFTRGVYRDLEPSDKKMCEKIEYEENELYTKFFTVNIEGIIKRNRIYEFLEKIGYPNSKLYGGIDEVYVPPNEYQDIEETLEKERIVLIIGTQECGKTYTAVQLMLKYYNEGYEPKWIKGGEEKERIEVRQKLENIEAELKPHRIIYFEDPFGRTKYEKREGLERKIGTIIESVERVKNVFVIITSREEVFKEFEKEKLSKADIQKFERRLNLKRPSYSPKKRKEILEKWAENEDCTWVKDDTLKDFVLKSIRDEKVLPTPLSMKDFSKATVDVDTEDRLKKIIEEKSEETAMAFSREIKNMTDDKVLFLLLLSVGRFTVDFVKTVYETMVKTLEVPHPGEIERVLHWFKDDKITVSDSVEFSHPSYAEALKYVLVENGYPTWIMKEIFSPLLLYLSEIDEASEAVAWTIAYHFDSLPKTVQKVLFTLCEKDDVARVVAWQIVHNFDNLSEKVQNFLCVLIEKDEALKAVTWTITYNFDKIHDNVRDLLFKLTEKGDAVKYVASSVIENFNKLPDEARDSILFKLPRKERNELLFKLTEKGDAVKYVARFLKENYDKFSDIPRDKLLLKLAEKDAAMETVAHLLEENYDEICDGIRVSILSKLSSNVKNKLLLKITEKKLDKFS